MADYREEFQKLFESLYIPIVGDEAKMERDMNDFLNQVYAHTPESLFRYRKCDDYSIDSFRDGTIYVCNASRFSDKYDSRVFIDRDRIRQETRDSLKAAISNLVIRGIKAQDSNLKSEKASKVCYWMECGLSEEQIVDRIIEEDFAGFIKESEEDMKIREPRFRNAAKLGCFTESVQSKFMWDHYANGYTGFALEYNLKELLIKYLKEREIFIPIFPVIYSDEMPDVTMDESNIYTLEESKKKEWMKGWETLYHAFSPNALHMYKPYLYKDKAEYSHEREWRLIYYDKEKNEDYALIPDLDCLKAIYYGPDITPENKSILHEIAARRGIAEYDVAFDLESRNYKLKIQNRGGPAGRSFLFDKITK